ncbi:MAG: insulinase family protein [Chitinophagales bacterium]|nr:insulinase family protein [Chitinophagales bacterium]
MANNVAQPKLVEEVVASENSIQIPYKKYLLPNGLIVILHQDNSNPIVYIDVTYHVGSARETPTRSGFAHFFEHMMFQGSDNVGDERHFAIVTEAGGTLNGTTNRDRTNYFETVPSNHLETALWLEADRMGYLLDAVTTKKFEIQRATVKNERQQNYDNRPYGLAGEKTYEALYPFGHPYSWTTIGYLEDIDRFNLEDLKNFFLRWYSPNNATLTVAGKFDEAQTLEWISKYYGNIPRGPGVKNMDKMPVTLNGDKFISYQDNIQFPLLQITYPSAPSNTKEEVALDVLSYLIGGEGNKNAPLYQKFIKTKKAMYANASNPSSELAGQFSFTFLAYPNMALKDINAELQEIINDFDRKGFDQAAFDEYITHEYANLVYSLQSVQRKGSTLAYYQTFTGSPQNFDKYIKTLRNLTLDDVKEAFEKYVKNKPAVYLSIYSKDHPDNIVAADNFSRPAIPADFLPDLSEYKGLTYVKGQDDFDRSVQPSPGDNPVVEIPQFWHQVWANGTKVIGMSYANLPMTSITYSFKAGQLYESIEKAGIASLMGRLLREGGGDYSSEEFQSELMKIGSRINVVSTIENVNVQVTSLNENLDRTIELMNEMLFRPRFDSLEFERIKLEQIEDIKHAKTIASEIATEVEAKLLFDKDNIRSFTELGTKETVQNISLDDIKQYYAKYFAPDYSELVIVGDITAANVLQKLGKLNKVEKKGIEKPEFHSVKTPDKTTIVFAHKDNSPQSQIKVVTRGMRYDALGDSYKADIANYPLGGMFNSHININLRERKGWTYGARSYFLSGHYLDEFIVSTSVKADVTDGAVTEILKEIDLYLKEGISPDELEFTKKSIGQRDALKYETASQKGSFLRTVIKNDFDSQLVNKQNKILADITKEELDGIMQKYVNKDKLYIIVVGDRNIVLDPLKQLGYPVIEMEIE